MHKTNFREIPNTTTCSALHNIMEYSELTVLNGCEL